MAVERCYCSCHDTNDAGVDMGDEIACVTACKECVNDHWPYMLGINPPGSFDPPKEPDLNGETGG